MTVAEVSALAALLWPSLLNTGKRIAITATYPAPETVPACSSRSRLFCIWSNLLTTGKCQRSQCRCVVCATTVGSNGVFGVVGDGCQRLVLDLPMAPARVKYGIREVNGHLLKAGRLSISNYKCLTRGAHCLDVGNL